MTATINGKIFRGVLFAPVSACPRLIVSTKFNLCKVPNKFVMQFINQAPGVVSRGPTLTQNPSPQTSQIAVAQPSQQAMKYAMPESSHSFQQAQATRPFPVIRAAPALAKEPKVRSDLQGVILTLGGPGSAHGRS